MGANVLGILRKRNISYPSNYEVLQFIDHLNQKKLIKFFK